VSFAALWAAQAGLPYLTAGLAGVGGRIKSSPEDFEVEEVPGFAPFGEGEHLLLWIEKRGIDARSMVHQVARRLDIDARDIGCAGMKDAVAITRQYISVPAKAEANLVALDGGGLRVLRRARHNEKLRTGELVGNRFRIIVRQLGGDAEARAAAIVQRLRQEGVPNFYGPQRFGREGATLRAGYQILTGDPAAPKDGFLKRLGISAVQAALFNTILSARLSSGTLARVQPGEVLVQLVTGGAFVADGTEQPRLERRQVVPAGPIFGPKMKTARGAMRAAEDAGLAAAGLTGAAFERMGKLALGTRRALLVWPEELEAVWRGDALELTMSLPTGTYATVVLREIMKNDGASAEEPEA
jgi:tRNA pseudouridine13 synthase